MFIIGPMFIICLLLDPQKETRSQPRLRFCLASRYGSRTQSERPWRHDNIESWRSRKATACALQSLSKLGEIHQLLTLIHLKAIYTLLSHHFFGLPVQIPITVRIHSRCPLEVSMVYNARSTCCAASSTQCALSVKWSHDVPWDSEFCLSWQQ